MVVTCLEELFPNKYDIYRITQDVFAVWHKDELGPKSKLDVADRIKCKFTHSTSNNSIAINGVAIGIVYESDITKENSVNLLLKTAEYAHEQGLIVTYQGEAKKAIDRHFMLSDALEDAIQSGLLSIALQSEDNFDFITLVDWVDKAMYRYKARSIKFNFVTEDEVTLQ